MSSTEALKSGDRQVKELRTRLLIIFTVLVLGITVLLSSAFLNKSSDAIRNNASSLIAANSTQLQLNVDSYFQKLETTVALLFSDENYYKYDATNSSLDEYTKIQYEDAIEAKIVDLGIMENFSDFGIIYADGYSVGWLSNTTRALFDDTSIYDEVSSKISNEKTDDGWFSGVNGSYDRLYYVKRINPNAVVLASFYSRELASVFTFPDALDGMVIRLINDNNEILYSSEKTEIGNLLPTDIASSVGNRTSMSVMDSFYLINVDSCDNGWRTVCVMPSSVVLADVAELRMFTIGIAVVLAVIFIILGFVLFRNISKSVDTMVVELENKAATDGLSSLLNKVTYETAVSEELERTINGTCMGVIIMDVDRFKSINDSLGHSYGDEVIVRTANVIKNVLPKDCTIGRIGGDEFSFTIKAADKSLEELNEYLSELMQELLDVFIKEFKKEHDQFGVSLSVGVHTFEYRGQVFESLYKNADAALYYSKENGKGRFTFFKEGMDNEK